MMMTKNKTSKVNINYNVAGVNTPPMPYPIYEPEPLIMGPDPIEYNGKIIPQFPIDYVT